MTRRRTPSRDLSTLDQVAAALRDAGRPVTVRELADGGAGAMLWFLPRTPHQIQPGDPGHSGEWEHYHECHTTGCIHSSRGTVSQPDLERLARRGLAERTKVGRTVYWSWTGTTLDLSAFEGQMSH